MTASSRMVIAVSPRLLPAVACVALTMLLGGCSNWKQTLGIEPVSPDEFAVESRAPLTIPPEFNLRPPEPGAPRPQEASMASKAQGAVDSAGPGEAGHQENGTLQYHGTNLADPNAQVADQSLAAKLLQAGDTNDSAVLENRKTTVLQGVY
jgi:hypothetical protein